MRIVEGVQSLYSSIARLSPDQSYASRVSASLGVLEHSAADGWDAFGIVERGVAWPAGFTTLLTHRYRSMISLCFEVDDVALGNGVLSPKDDLSVRRKLMCEGCKVAARHLI